MPIWLSTYVRWCRAECPGQLMVSNCMWYGSEAKLFCVCSWGIMGVNYIEDGVRFNCVFVVNWLFCCVPLYMWNLSIVSINLPFPVVYSMSLISLIGPVEWLLSSRWVAKLDFLLLYLKSWKCSLYLFGMIYQSGQYISCCSLGM